MATTQTKGPLDRPLLSPIGIAGFLMAVGYERATARPRPGEACKACQLRRAGGVAMFAEALKQGLEMGGVQ